jgi:hypothetical protein
MSRASVERAALHFDENQVVRKVMTAYAGAARKKGLYPELVELWG